jgi:hypothetical protein
MYHTTFRMQSLLLLVAVAATLFTAGCKKDDATSGEVITKVVVHLTGIGNNFDQEFEAEDSDGDGVFNSIDTINLTAAEAYKCHLHVYDETKTPVEDITEEIEEESNDHLFVFTPAFTGLEVSNLNTDGNGAPFGLESIWVTALVGTGTIKIALHHEPTDKNAADPGGDVDFEVSFPVIVQ